MKKLTKSRVVWGGVALTLFYAILVLLVPMPLLIDVLNGIFLGIMIAVAYVYFPVIWSSLRERQFDRVSQLAIGIGCLWLSIAMLRGYSAYWRMTGITATTALNNPFLGYGIFIAIVGGALHITAPGFSADDVARLDPIRFGGNNRRLLLWFGLAGGVLSLVVRALGFHVY